MGGRDSVSEGIYLQWYSMDGAVPSGAPYTSRSRVLR
jgi:hypothetical protein